VSAHGPHHPRGVLDVLRERGLDALVEAGLDGGSVPRGATGGRALCLRAARGLHLRDETAYALARGASALALLDTSAGSATPSARASSARERPRLSGSNSGDRKDDGSTYGQSTDDVPPPAGKRNDHAPG
jgi:hypothetical protein